MLQWHRDLNYHDMWVAEDFPYRLYVDGERFNYKIMKCGLLEERRVGGGGHSLPCAAATLKVWAEEHLQLRHLPHYNWDQIKVP